jgi:hypothetical protein
MTGKLRLIDEGIDGFRHYLDGEPVHCGEVLEIQLDSGAWAVGRYEWNFRAGGEPVLFTSADEGMVLTEGHVLRWPER